MGMDMDMVLSIIVAVIELSMLLYYMSDLSLNEKYRVGKRFLVYGLIVTLSFFTWIFFENLFLKLVFFNLFLSLILLQIYKEHLWVTELYIATYSLVLLFSEVIINISAKTLIYQLYNLTPLFFETVCSLLAKFLTLILLFFLKKGMRKIILKKPLIQDMGLMFIQIITDILFFIFISVSIQTLTFVSEGLVTLYVLCIFFIVIFFITNLYYTEYFVEIRRRDLSLEEELKLAQMRSKLYENQIHEEYEIKSMYHDMKNHLLILKDQTLTPKENETYISKLEEKINKLNDCIHTGNSYLDILIKEKRNICIDHNIELDLQINLCKIFVLNPVEICILFGNLFDNAIEANLRISSPEKRKIEAIAHNKNKNFVIKFENPIEETFAWPRFRLTTTKSDQRNHGYGMKNMIRLIREKQGQYTITTKDNAFQIYIIIPIEDH